MKTPLVVLLAALAGGTLAVRALRADPDAQGPRSQTTYYANGQVESECPTRGGQREGTCTRYYPDGSKMSEGDYVAGRMEGRWTFWRKDGSVDAERSGLYASGERTGP